MPTTLPLDLDYTNGFASVSFEVTKFWQTHQASTTQKPLELDIWLREEIGEFWKTTRARTM